MRCSLPEDRSIVAPERTGASAAPCRILIVSDAWSPQVNGVVRTLGMIAAQLSSMGHIVEVIGPDRFRTLPCPSYPEIRLAMMPRRRLVGLITAFNPDRLHIATEGPLGQAARAWALRNHMPFTTAFHTRFAEYLRLRTGIPLRLTYAWLRYFHGPARGTMVATPSLAKDLGARGFRHIRPWSRGVDLDLFHPGPYNEFPVPRPIFLYVGRIAIEKNIGAFLNLDLTGSKVVVGDGPQLESLRLRYPGVLFTGPRFGVDLARAYASADVFVFPSRTDTFGLVLLEALACGTPVAAYPVTGPLDVLTDPRVGAMSEDLAQAALQALRADRAACRAHAELFSWRSSAESFLRNLEPLHAE